jgi:hypothetical protein
MDLSLILSYVKGLPDWIVAGVLGAFLVISFFLKRKEVDLTQLTTVSKLQTDQLTVLITQNQKLSEELHAVRKELTEAYRIINDMRNRMTELEEMLRKKSS